MFKSVYGLGGDYDADGRCPVCCGRGYPACSTNGSTCRSRRISSPVWRSSKRWCPTARRALSCCSAARPARAWCRPSPRDARSAPSSASTIRSACPTGSSNRSASSISPDRRADPDRAGQQRRVWRPLIRSFCDAVSNGRVFPPARFDEASTGAPMQALPARSRPGGTVRPSSTTTRPDGRNDSPSACCRSGLMISPPARSPTHGSLTCRVR